MIRAEELLHTRESPLLFTIVDGRFLVNPGKNHSVLPSLSSSLLEVSPALVPEKNKIL